MVLEATSGRNVYPGREPLMVLGRASPANSRFLSGPVVIQLR